MPSSVIWGRILLLLVGAIGGASLVGGLQSRTLAAEPASSVPLSPVSVSLRRFDVKPGQEATFNEWMAYLRDHQREAVATFDREHVYYEAAFTTPNEPGRFYVLSIDSPGGASSATSPYEIDRRHRAYRDLAVVKSSKRELVTEYGFAPDFIFQAIRAQQVRRAAETKNKP